MRVEVSQVVDRPITLVFHWYADDHVRNHPRWDPDIDLWLDSDAPIDVGTVIRRRNRRYGTPVEGTMEVVEFERDRAFRVLIQDGSMRSKGWVTFEPIAPEQTRITLGAEAAEWDDSIRDVIRTAMERSAQNIKNLMEAEIGPVAA